MAIAGCEELYTLPWSSVLGVTLDDEREDLFEIEHRFDSSTVMADVVFLG